MDSPSEYVARLEADLRSEKAKSARLEADLRGAVTRAANLEAELKSKENELQVSDELRGGLFDSGIKSAQVTHRALDQLSKMRPVVEAAEAFYDDSNSINLKFALDAAVEKYRETGKPS